MTAYFGFTCSGSSDDGRIRTSTTPISPTYAKQILELQEAEATEEDLHPIIAEAITESYLRNGALGPMACARISRTSSP
ncbi:hypothetical protein J2S54_000040 [Streptomyces sp. DSM 42143]|uniref:hypothetical protein n=1 Tax=Streptomyces sp. DSM 42143 TaxID=2817711 RepID=UPI00278A7A82|nr:hypothetical protein [Streptomyces sp. DSM 42143]MDQ0383220.1 hypothetical protein [Streptomyces sp. DSM 42143]